MFEEQMYVSRINHEEEQMYAWRAKVCFVVARRVLYFLMDMLGRCMFHVTGLLEDILACTHGDAEPRINT